MKRLLLAAMATALTAVVAFAAADLTLSTGTKFLPGPRLIDGSDLNIVLQAVNDLRDQMDGTKAITPSCTITGATPQTCNGVTGLVTTTAFTNASLTSATYVINNNLVTFNSNVQCMIDSYSGTIGANGQPVITSCLSGTGNITVYVGNVHATNALNGTIKVAFRVTN